MKGRRHSLCHCGPHKFLLVFEWNAKCNKHEEPIRGDITKKLRRKRGLRKDLKVLEDKEGLVVARDVAEWVAFLWEDGARGTEYLNQKIEHGKAIQHDLG